MVQRSLGRLNFALVHGKRATLTAPPAVGEPEPLELFEARILRILGE